MNKKWKRDDLIVRSPGGQLPAHSAGPGLYVILHGNISPGGGFQGGVLAASGVLLPIPGLRLQGIATAINMERMHRLEAVGAIAYVLFAMLGIFAGYNFCRNILWNSGNIRRPVELRHDSARELRGRLQGADGRGLPAAAGDLPARHGRGPRV